MQFMNAEVQRLFFQAHKERRVKRDLALVEASDEHREKLDNCLDIIVCHHPDIWSQGTGILLIAPKNRGHTDAQKRAVQFRIESNNDYSYRRYYLAYEDEHIGFFIRKTLEYRDRMRIFLCDSEIEGVPLSAEIHDMFDYVENNISQELENLSVQSDFSRKKGIQRYGIEFDYHRSMTKYCYDHQIYDHIEEFARIDRVCNPLRNVLLDIFPDILNNEPVARMLLSIEDYNSDLYIDFEVDSDLYIDLDSFPDHLPDLVKSTGECNVCYIYGETLEWPCHPSHALCKNCTDKIFARNALCPSCRKHIWLSD